MRERAEVGDSKRVRMKAAKRATPANGPSSPLRGEVHKRSLGDQAAPDPEVDKQAHSRRRPQQRRTPGEYARDQRAVANLSLRGWTQAKMAEYLNLGVETIREHLENLDNYFIELQREAGEKRKGRQLQVIEHLLDTTLKGIEKAQEPTKKRTVEGKTGPKGAEGGNLGGKVVETTEPGKVDGTLIQAARGLLSHEADLLGLKAPQELKHILEERRAGKEAMLEILKEEIKDPEVLRRIADRLSSIGAEPEGKVAA